MLAGLGDGPRATMLERASSSPRIKWAVTSTGLVLIACLFIFLSQRSGAASITAQRSFHLLVPATSSNKNLCRLLLSTTALAFPSPVLINWNAHEDANLYKQHIAKVSGILRYLSTFPEENDDDLVLIVDGYDLIFQLSPEVVISRYHDIMKTANKRLESRLGRELMQERAIYQSVLFGPDKICWPEDVTRAACWAVPDSTLPPYAFGPDTDSGKFRAHYRPRWLNSGTVLGPIRDIKTLMAAALERIDRHDTNIVSDQYHLANLFGEQEYARKILGNETVTPAQIVWIHDGWNGEGYFENVTFQVPDEITFPDYHITIDYESKLFQTMSYYNQYIGWISYDGSVDRGQILQHALTAYTHYDLPNDIATSPPPLSMSAARLESQSYEALFSPAMDPRSRDPYPVDLPIPPSLAWKDLTLGTNIATRQVFALLHFTPPKEFRDRWINRMWYFPYARAIIRESKPGKRRLLTVTPENGGVRWWSYEANVTDEIETPRNSSGAFADDGRWLTWQDLCSNHEDAVFYNIKEMNELVETTDGVNG